MVLPQSICVPMHCDCIGSGLVIWIARKTISHISSHWFIQMQFSFSMPLQRSLILSLPLFLSISRLFHSHMMDVLFLHLISMLLWMLFVPFFSAVHPIPMHVAEVAGGVTAPNCKMGSVELSQKSLLSINAHFKMHMHFNQKDNLWWRYRFNTFETILQPFIGTLFIICVFILGHTFSCIALFSVLHFVRSIVFYPVHSLFVASFNRDIYIWAIATAQNQTYESEKIFCEYTRHRNAFCKKKSTNTKYASPSIAFVKSLSIPPNFIAMVKYYLLILLGIFDA